MRPAVLRPIAHEYPDSLPAPAEVRCYSFAETFAEKLRAMGERALPPMYGRLVMGLGDKKRPAYELVSEGSAPLSAANWCDDKRNNI